jgi:GT2 family glycosyltransferase
MTCASIVIPTRARPDYLGVALASIVPQAQALGAEVLVIDDAGLSPEIRALVERAGARYEAHLKPLGLNVARNTGVQRSSGELVVFVDDDVEVCAGWLAAILAAAQEYPDVQVFTGPIRARLEGNPPRSCGREKPPITSLDLGAADTDTPYAWGANMTVRRSALERVGPFDISLQDAGDEQEWQDRLKSAEHGQVMYIAAAALDHRRTASDAALNRLLRAAKARGQAARRFDAWRGQAPGLSRELITLAGCMGHVVRRRCPAGATMVAHSLGRLAQGLSELGKDSAREAGAPDDEDFLSGESGTVAGFDALRRSMADELTDAVELAGGRRLRLLLQARRHPSRQRVLAVGVERPQRHAIAQAMHTELMRSRHEVKLDLRAPGSLGKFANLNLLLASHSLEDYDWLLVIDDDVVLPKGFLDRFLFLVGRFSLDLAQPAHRLNSHAGWQVTRRRLASVVRETNFVEIGPVTAFAPSTFSVLLPFPELQMGWGLDVHWAALARQHGWRAGIVDAVSISHRVARAAESYSREAAVSEARAFLADRPYLSATEAQRTLVHHRHW